MHITFRVGFNKDHKDDDPDILCREWARNMHWYFETELASPLQERLVFTSAHHEEYIEGFEFRRLADGAPLPTAQQWIQDIRAVFH